MTKPARIIFISVLVLTPLVPLFLLLNSLFSLPTPARFAARRARAEVIANYGLWNFNSPSEDLNALYPEYDFKWIFTPNPEYPLPPSKNLILDHFWVIEGLEQDFYPRSCSDLETIENRHKVVATGKFWGIDFIREEVENTWFNYLDLNADCTFFGENILGYDRYKQTVPDASVEVWRDEMYFRAIRGFYNYIKSRNPPEKIGITMGGYSMIDWKSHFGEKAMGFIKNNYDYVVVYIYTQDLEQFERDTKKYLTLIDELFPRQQKFWIVSRSWLPSEIEPEIIQVEVKNVLDRGMVIVSYGPTGLEPPEVIDHMVKSINLYTSALKNYYEDYIMGKNMITGKTGNTYGFVDTLPFGDANGDGKVGGVDLELLKQDYLGQPVHNTDFNSDGRVDIEDFAILQKNYSP